MPFGESVYLGLGFLGIAVMFPMALVLTKSLVDFSAICGLSLSAGTRGFLS